MMKQQDSHKCPEKSVWKRHEVWICVSGLVLAGAIAGGSITQYFVRNDANDQLEEIRQAYNEASQSRLAALQLCIKQNTAAVNNAAGQAAAAKNAAEKAATKAMAAQQAADKAANAIENSK